MKAIKAVMTEMKAKVEAILNYAADSLKVDRSPTILLS